VSITNLAGKAYDKFVELPESAGHVDALPGWQDRAEQNLQGISRSTSFIETLASIALPIGFIAGWFWGDSRRK
jgi:hypothetical protein